MVTIGIIGYGNFGSFLANYIVTHKRWKGQCRIRCYDNAPSKQDSIPLEMQANISQICQSDYIVLAIQAENLIAVVSDMQSSALNPQVILIGAFSMQQWPLSQIRVLLPGYKYFSIHAMFGPSAYDSQGSMAGFNIVMPNADIENHYILEQIEDIFLSERLLVVKLSAEQHDQISATTLVLHNIVGQIILKSGIIVPDELYDLHAIVEAVRKSGFLLTQNLCRYNIYVKQVFERFINALKQTYGELKVSESGVVASFHDICLFIGAALAKMSLLSEVLDTLNYQRLRRFSEFSKMQILSSSHGLESYRNFVINSCELYALFFDDSMQALLSQGLFELPVLVKSSPAFHYKLTQ